LLVDEAQKITPESLEVLRTCLITKPMNINFAAGNHGADGISSARQKDK
jgi:hypothetical protein